jgi:hypothetical protein
MKKKFFSRNQRAAPVITICICLLIINIWNSFYVGDHSENQKKDI